MANQISNSEITSLDSNDKKENNDGITISHV